MDEHARRVCAPLLAAWVEFEQGQATLLDLSRLAEQASEALDNANAPLPQRLRDAAADLEYAYHASEREEHMSAGRRTLGPVFAEIDVPEMTESVLEELELARIEDGYIGSITRRGVDGAVAWQAFPPGGDRDAWVSVSVDDGVVTAISWSGWQVRLSFGTGAEVARDFTK